MKTGTPIGVPPNTKLLRIERVSSESYWRVWLQQSPCGRYGTMLHLFDSGAVHRLVLRADEGDEVFIVKES